MAYVCYLFHNHIIMFDVIIVYTVFSKYILNYDQTTRILQNTIILLKICLLDAMPIRASKLLVVM